jgi:antitoxin component YwqK of YwqJK toxin-antitoxin module
MQTERHPNGAVKSITYRQNGLRHRNNEPAFQVWNEAGELIIEEWRQNGFLHRNNGPACQQWTSGVLIREEWRQNGRWHRDNGPAVRRWNKAGELFLEIWYQNDRALTAEEIEKILRPVDIMAAIWTLPQPIAEEIASVFRAC